MSEMKKQLLGVVLDNSAALPKEKLAALMSGFRHLLTQAENFPMLDWELLTFDGFAPAVAKSFEQNEIQPVRAGGMPLVGRALECAAERLLTRAKETQTPYRPWLILLSAGFCFDEPAAAVARLEGEEQLIYLPFRLGTAIHNERMQAADRIKRMIAIKEDGIDGFFAFLETLLTRRTQGGEDTALKFRKNDFEGWGEL